MQLDISAKRLQQPPSEELNLLCRGQWSRMRQAHLECLLIIGDRSAEWQPRKLGKMICAEWGSKTLLAQGPEHRPGDGVDVAGVAFQHVEPMLRDANHMQGCRPHLVGFTSSLRAEEVVAAIKPANWIFLAVEDWKGQFVIARNGSAIIVVIEMILWRLLEGWNLGWRVGKRDLSDGNRPVWGVGVDDD